MITINFNIYYLTEQEVRRWCDSRSAHQSSDLPSWLQLRQPQALCPDGTMSGEPRDLSSYLIGQWFTFPQEEQDCCDL